jgi:predicted RNA-binding protein YlxR (DUF448 family)
MGKRPQRRRHVPQRTCIACRTVRPKRELVRVVRTAEGTVLVDESGKRSGRGAYLCRQQVCWESALSQRKLDRALKVTVPAEAIDGLREYAAGLPKQLPTESEGEKEPDKGVSV